MGKNDKERKLGKKDRIVGMTSAQLYVDKLTYPALKRECIIRGLPFECVGDYSVLKMQSWFLHNFPNKVNMALLNEYDEWVEKMLKERGTDPCLYDPVFRLGSVGATDGDITKRKRVSTIISAPKHRREKTTDGLFTGTKKAYTFALQAEGKTKAETTELVMKQFPDAKEKSISIWYNKAKKKHGK